ncbi:MAG: hypothetical protein VB108_00725 [Anaerolineaceae bacterium]|nr:hypothetical protein [Anaerolineaceae bacterium]
MNKTQKKEMLNRIGEDLVPETADIYPALAARFEARHNQASKPLVQKLAPAVMLLLCLGLFFAFTQPGKVFAQEVQQRLQTYTWHWKIKDAEKEAGFKAMLPAEIPDGLVLKGAEYDLSGNKMMIFFESAHYTTNGLMISQCRIGSCEPPFIAVGSKTLPHSQIYNDTKNQVPSFKSVKVAGADGQFVDGVWHFLDDKTAAWDETGWFKQIRFDKGDFTFMLSYFGSPELMNETKLIDIAASLR